jgi:hypothetical protein
MVGLNLQLAVRASQPLDCSCCSPFPAPLLFPYKLLDLFVAMNLFVALAQFLPRSSLLHRI